MVERIRYDNEGSMIIISVSTAAMFGNYVLSLLMSSPSTPEDASKRNPTPFPFQPERLEYLTLISFDRPISMIRFVERKSQGSDIPIYPPHERVSSHECNSTH